MWYTVLHMHQASRNIVALLLFVGLLFPHTVFLASSEAFQSHYLLSDQELQDWQTMNRADIQAFLNEKNGYIKDYKAEDEEGVIRTTADIIQRAAAAYRINPKYVLVKLQKEQSLITDTNPTENQLSGATGYGITDSCGWSCETYLKNKGFGKQVASTAGIMRWYYDHADTESWIKKPGVAYTIDGESITPANQATAFLYTYTPHLTGNKNFWTLWNTWFQQYYPDGSLLKSLSTNDTYIIQNGEKRKFTTPGALVTRYDPKYVIPVPHSELSNYTDGGDIDLPNYSVVTDGAQYYLIDYDTARPFDSQNTVKALGYHPDEILDVTSSDIAAYAVGKTILDSGKAFGELVRVKENNRLYFVEDDSYHPISDDRIARINYPSLLERIVPASSFANLTMEETVLVRDGALFGIEGDNKIYVMEHGKKRHIANETVFESYGYKWGNIVWINITAGGLHPTGEAIYAARHNIVSDTVAGNEKKNETPAPEATPSVTDLMVKTPAPHISFIGPTFDTDTDGYVIAEHDTGAILAGKNIDTIRPAASLTKVMAGYRLMKEGLRTERVTEYVPAVHKAEHHYYRITEGERVLNQHLLYASLVSSLNTPTKMLVSSVEPKETLFISRMNEQANEWGLQTTHFDDVYGGSDDTVTTPREYLTLFTHATKNKTMRDILGMESYAYTEVRDVDGKPDHTDVNNNKLVAEMASLPYRILASKTGYLYKSGDNLAMLLERKSDGKRFVVITFGNPNHTNRFETPRTLAAWAMKTF